MRVLKKSVPFAELLACLDRENQLPVSLSVGREYLVAANTEFGGVWTLVALSRADILNIMLPMHTHGNPSPLVPDWLPVSAVLERVKERTQETGECWENIHWHKDRDFSQIHVFLKWQDGGLRHVDGLHRLVAYAMFDKKDEVLAYVAGFVDHAFEVVKPSWKRDMMRNAHPGCVAILLTAIMAWLSMQQSAMSVNDLAR